MWLDGGWGYDAESQLKIGRSSVHGDNSWRGALMAKFNFHTTIWGNGAQFINAEIVQHHNVLSTQNFDFIAGWRDATGNNGSYVIIIWLRGGGTTYHYKSEYSTSCTVYDGVINPLPYQEVNGPAHSYKTLKDEYVNSNGMSKESTAYFLGPQPNYFAGSVGIGTYNPREYKLAVNGKIRAQEIKVEASPWPDYVFTKSYQLPTLQETERHIKEKGHLPGIPSAAEVKANGIDLGEMNAKLLQKTEELTLHLIEENKENINSQKKLKVQELKLIEQAEKLKCQEETISMIIRRLEQLESKK